MPTGTHETRNTYVVQVPVILRSYYLKDGPGVCYGLRPYCLDRQGAFDLSVAGVCHHVRLIMKVTWRGPGEAPNPVPVRVRQTVRVQ